VFVTGQKNSDFDTRYFRDFIEKSNLLCIYCSKNHFFKK
jgi:hypothetical protein